MKAFAIIALHCALFVAVRGHHQHSVDGPVYDGMNSILSDSHDHAQLIADDLAKRLNETFNMIKNSVDQLKDNNSFTQEIELLKVQGDDVQKCLKEHELSIAQFMRKLVNTYESCSKEAKQEVHDLMEKIKEHVAVIKGAPKQIKEISNECLTQDERNAAASVLCSVTRIAEVQEDVFEANQSIQKYINHGFEDIEAYSSNKCEGIEGLRKEFDTLLGEIETCVKKSNQ